MRTVALYACNTFVVKSVKGSYKKAFAIENGYSFMLKYRYGRANSTVRTRAIRARENSADKCAR